MSQRGFIQIPLLIALVVSVLVAGAVVFRPVLKNFFETNEKPTVAVTQQEVPDEQVELEETIQKSVPQTEIDAVSDISVQQPVPPPQSAPQPQAPAVTTSSGPIITRVNIESYQITTRVDWETNEATESKLFLLSTPIPSTSTFISQSGLSTRHSVIINNLLPGATYSYEIEAIAKDASLSKTTGKFTIQPTITITQVDSASFYITNNSLDTGTIKHLHFNQVDRDNTYDLPNIGIADIKFRHQNSGEIQEWHVWSEEKNDWIFATPVVSPKETLVVYLQGLGIKWTGIEYKPCSIVDIRSGNNVVFADVNFLGNESATSIIPQLQPPQFTNCEAQESESFDFEIKQPSSSNQPAVTQ